MPRGWPKGVKRGPWSPSQLSKQRAAHTKYPGAPFSRSKRLRVKFKVPGILEICRAAKEKPCADCKRSYSHYVMDFDHVRGKKLFILSEAKRFTRAQVVSEIAKCDVVCANCHRERTHAQK